MDDTNAVRADEIRWSLEPTPTRDFLCFSEVDLFAEVLVLREMRSDLLTQLHQHQTALSLARYEIARLRAELRA